MPFAPRSEQPGGDEADPRITVILLSEGSDKVLQCSAEILVFVVGRFHFRWRQRLSIRVEVLMHLQTIIKQELRNDVCLVWILQINPKNGLMTTAGDFVEQLLQRLPIEFFIAFDQVREPHIIEFQ